MSEALLRAMAKTSGRRVSDAAFDELYRRELELQRRRATRVALARSGATDTDVNAAAELAAHVRIGLERAGRSR